MALLCTKHCSKFWEFSMNKPGKTFCCNGTSLYWEKHVINKVNKSYMVC